MKRMTFRKFTIIGLLFLISCANIDVPVTSTEENKEETIENGYPLSGVEENEVENPGYPVIMQTEKNESETTANPKLGIVKGYLLHLGDPVIGYNVYLADIVIDNQGNETTASLKRSSSPQATLNENGYFEFINVPPGRYALMFFDGVNAYLLLKPNQIKEEAIKVDVTGSEEINLGVLDYEDFPLD